MNELLRLANELMEARAKASDGVWDTDYVEEWCEYETDAEFIATAANHAVDIIKGYQDLLRRIVATWDVTDEHQIPSPLYSVMTEARELLPQEQSNE